MYNELMTILNIASYQFLPLSNLSDMRTLWLEQCNSLALKGTILLSEEGINLNLAGTENNISQFKLFIKSQPLFSQMTFRESYSEMYPFRRMKVKIKKEIITMRNPQVHAELQRAPDISPQEFKKWLDENRDITILDTRNDYEVRFGTFQGAMQLHINDFSEFPAVCEKVSREKPIVMFCTGGIRCEKASLQMLNSGYRDVYQLDGGILNYFAKVGGVHYDGECFVFDQRVALKADLQSSGVQQCVRCEGPVKNLSGSICSNCL